MLRKYLLSNKQGKKVCASGTVLIEESQAGQVEFEPARRVAECRDRSRRWGAVQAWGKHRKKRRPLVDQGQPFCVGGDPNP